MSINNREELNNYYQYFNDLVDEYTEKWKIRPSNLKRYLQPGSERFNKFLERSKTKLKLKSGQEINDAYGRLVLQNVIEDRLAMEKDGVLNFNNFQILESVEYKIDILANCLYKGIDKADGNYEKFLADYFDTNLSQITIVNPSVSENQIASMIASSNHLFRLNDWSNEYDIVLWSISDFDVISENIKEFLFHEVTNKSVEVSGLKLELSHFIDSELFMEKVESLLSDEYLVHLVSSCLGEFQFDSNSKQRGYFLWKHVSS